jgi:hypothetical protein
MVGATTPSGRETSEYRPDFTIATRTDPIITSVPFGIGTDHEVSFVGARTPPQLF